MKRQLINTLTLATFTSLLLMLASTQAFSQFKQQSKRSLFSDVKAINVGDAITVLITEETSAGNSASTNSGRSTDLSGSASINTGSSSSLDAGIGTGNQFKGSGETSRKESIKSKLSAKVVEVDNNGNLRIKGTRNTTVNGEKQTIIIEGFVRPVDISSNNSIYSYNILDLTLSIEGNGEISKVQEPGLITKFLRILF